MPGIAELNEVHDPVLRAALETVAGYEGGDADETADRGGRTRFGISLTYLLSLGADRGGDLDGDGDVDRDDVAAVTPGKARAFFFRDFWQPVGCPFVAKFSPELATKMLDMAIVAGPGTAVRCLQRALVAVGDQVGIDGGYGPLTEAAVGRAAQQGRMGWLLAEYRLQAIRHYFRITYRNRSQVPFLLGWVKRGGDFEEP